MKLGFVAVIRSDGDECEYIYDSDDEDDGDGDGDDTVPFMCATMTRLIPSGLPFPSATPSFRLRLP